ncbi:MAG: hypothetical protein AAGC55_32375, partial [Myxococcota bacterium]
MFRSSSSAPIAAALAALAALACSGKSDSHSDGQRTAATASDRAGSRSLPARWHYTFKPSADVATMTTQVCFAGQVPTVLDAQMPAARWSLVGRPQRVIRGVAQLERKPLEHGVSGIDLAPVRPGDCVEWVQDLRATADKAENKRQVRAVGDDLLMSPDYWLWKPSPRTGAVLTASCELPDGVAVAVPWPKTGPDGSYLIPETTFDWRIYGAIGRFELATIALGDNDRAARLNVAILGDEWTAPRELLLDWLKHSAQAVAALYPGFPVTEGCLILVPVPGNRVVFGSVSQGGGPSAIILAGVEVTDDDLRDDWVAVHEMLHW